MTENSPWRGKSLTVRELRWYNLQPVVFFEGVDDRTAAESLAKAILLIDKDESELPEEADAWYDHQLVGLTAMRDGAAVGTVARVDHLPSQDLLIVQTGSDEVMVPFVKAIVPAVDLAAGTVTLTPPMGLFEPVIDDDPEPEAAEPEAADTEAAEPETSESDGLTAADSHPNGPTRADP